MLNHTGPICSLRLFKVKTSKNSSQPFHQLQLLLLEPPLLLPEPPPLLPRLKRRSQVSYYCKLTYLAKEEKKEEEADVDMGGLFGDDY